MVLAGRVLLLGASSPELLGGDIGAVFIAGADGACEM